VFLPIPALFTFSRNKAIADYLASNGYASTLAEFQKEAGITVKPTVVLLEVGSLIFLIVKQV
jgi:LisH